MVSVPNVRDFAVDLHSSPVPTEGTLQCIYCQLGLCCCWLTIITIWWGVLSGQRGHCGGVLQVVSWAL
jgi:hypothetical protein